MTDQVEEIKQKVDIASVIGEYITLKKAGSNFKALCPFHSEKTPSFMVSSELQIFKCFGCGESGDVISFLQKYDGMEFYEALKYLAEKTGVKLEPFGKSDSGSKDKLYRINSLISRFYHYILLNHPAGSVALNYLLKDRGLKKNTIETFNLGYSPDHPIAFKKYLVEKKGVTLRELQEVGVVYQKEGRLYDRFRGRIIFPLLDHRGNTIGFAGRILPHDKNKEIAKYINTPETVIYHKSKVLYGLSYVKNDIKKEGYVIVVEGELDMISSWQAGIRNVVAIKGSALTEEQTKLLTRFTKNLVFALDADFAGDEAVKRAIVIAERQGFDIKVAKLTESKDPDEAARRDPVGLKNAILNARGIWDFIIDSIFTKYKGISGEEKAKISRELMPILSTISDKIVQAHYINLVAQKLGVPSDAVLEEIQKTRKEQTQKPKLETFIKTLTKTRRELLEERLLTVVFRYNPKLLLEKEYSVLLTTSFAKRILEEFLEFSKNADEFDPSSFSEYLPRELFDGYVDIVLKEVKGLDDVGSYQKELDLISREIKTLKIKQSLEKLGSLIKKHEESDDKKNLRDSEEKFGQLTKKLSELEAKNL